MTTPDLSSSTSLGREVPSHAGWQMYRELPQYAHGTS